jgi:hypothetical protein
VRTEVADPYRWYEDANADLHWLLRRRPEYAERKTWLLRHIAAKQRRPGRKGLCGRSLMWATGRHVRGKKTVGCTACIERYEELLKEERRDNGSAD